jgi:hypothetical protein
MTIGVVEIFFWISDFGDADVENLIVGFDTAISAGCNLKISAI